MKNFMLKSVNLLFVLFILVSVSAVCKSARSGAETRMPRPLQVARKNTGSLILVNQGAELLSRGKTQQAEVLLGQALVKNPQSPEAAYNFGLALAFNGKFREAVQANFKALELKEQFPEAHLALGNLFLTMGDFDQAIKAFDQAEYLSPGPFITRAARFNRAIALSRLKRFAEAEVAFSECLAANPDDQAIPFQLAALQLQQNKPEAALNWLDTMTNEFEIESNLMRARAYLKLKDIKNARLALNKTQQLLKNDSYLESNNDLNRIIKKVENEIKESVEAGQ
jgi:tetratricopeptide (TPR) repeat protein